MSTDNKDRIELKELSGLLSRHDISVVDGALYFEKALLHNESSWKAYVYREPTTHKKPHIHIRCSDGTEYVIDFLGKNITGNILKPVIRKKVLYWLEKSNGSATAAKKWNELNS